MTVHTTATRTVLRARDLRVSFQGREVLRGVDLDVRAGEFLAIMGPSGSGKSTLLYALSGMDSTSAGTAELDGAELTEMTEKQLGELRLHRMGFVFQQVHLLADLNLLDNVVLPGFQARTLPRSRVIAWARSLMERAGVADLADREITGASGGQLQRVGICRALINSPTIVFADEPTGALDSASARQVMGMLTELRDEGITLVMVTHDPRVAAHAERVVGMVDGHLAGELPLGVPGGDDDLNDRHRRVSEWLRHLEVPTGLT